ncbi:hypothetical protein BDV25DRAFT_146386 [Aspergillus avenaceus]|uniref:Uncharacterized protein n=1 Tax=Aspergillus avenaceus TaxID=36643 RepID=A0A5N6U9F1_ASPAV|nr:hypothetical protein BDV25DRAFT_146386 [Aspergillus avenaceus]
MCIHDQQDVAVVSCKGKQPSTRPGRPHFYLHPTIYAQCLNSRMTGTYDHRVWRTGLPVRSAVLKPHAGRLVVGWVTTSESLLLVPTMF